jgi:hypothetical protein
MGAIGTLAEQLRALRERQSAHEAAGEQLKQQIKQTQEQLVSAMVDAETPSFTQDGRRFTLYRSHYASVRAEHRAAVVEYCRRHNLPFVEERLDDRQLRAWVAEHLDDERELPAELRDKIHCYTAVSVRIAADRRAPKASGEPPDELPF